MKTKQQTEALRYFKEHAGDWNSKTQSTDPRNVNVIRQRNGFVLHVIERRAITTRALDVGCGTGDLVCDIARLGIETDGVDFAGEMIAIARAAAEQEGLQRAQFHSCSIFDFDFAERRYDVIAANGFIEYISVAELERLLDLARRALNPGGSLVLGSRNRLFNVLSLNRFTLEEIHNRAASLLLGEAIALASGASLEVVAEGETAALQSPESGRGRTGIDVSTRYQFTPGQLMKMMRARGFSIAQLYPVHIHGAPPAFKDQLPDVHASISNLLQAYAHQQSCLVPYSSSFMLHGRQGG
jgi:2-polyprenyl-3-methyl-5-hydroxy-6-metoxy-1,4-benzoquinol methylase